MCHKTLSRKIRLATKDSSYISQNKMCHKTLSRKIRLATKGRRYICHRNKPNKAIKQANNDSHNTTQKHKKHILG
jgi:ribosomal protein L39E